MRADYTIAVNRRPPPAAATSCPATRVDVGFDARAAHSAGHPGRQPETLQTTVVIQNVRVLAWT